MIKNKIKKIIYETELTDKECELFCIWDYGDSYDYGVYESGYVFKSEACKKECFENRKKELINDIERMGCDNVLDLRYWSAKFDKKIINYIKTI